MGVWNLIGVLVLIVMLGGIFTGLGKDSTDPEDGRSGLVVLTDNATGVQYVSSGFGKLFGNITPRIGADGKPYIEGE